MIQTSRRKLIVGLGSLIAAPAIVRYASIMPVKAAIILPPPGEWWCVEVLAVCNVRGYRILDPSGRSWYHIEHPDPSTIFPGALL